MTPRGLVLSLTGVALVALAAGAAVDVLPWDRGITEAAVRARTPVTTSPSVSLVGHRLVRGEGPSFPSGHPFAVAASWGLLPYVIPRRSLRVVWLLIPAVAATRVWLGVHWTSDAIAGSLLGIVGLALLDPHLRRPVRAASARQGMLAR